MQREEWEKIKRELGNPESVNDSTRDFNLLTADLFPLKLFGQVDADTEWEDDEDKSSRLFVHTDSYEVFKHKSNLFMFGRRGSGKTALIKMFDFEINNGLHAERYNYSRIIYQEDTFFRLTLELRPFLNYHSDQELTHVLKEKLIWAIYTTAMIAVTKATKSSNPKLVNIRKYLADENLIESENSYIVSTPIAKAAAIFSKSIEAATASQSWIQNAALSHALRQLDSQQYNEALNSLVGYLKEKKHHCLVMIDSQELYRLGDTVSECAVSALIDAVLQIYSHYSTYRILAKAAFPSEMVPHLRPANRGKMTDKEHFIFWKHGDLVRLISKRYCQVLNEQEKAASVQDCEQIRNPETFVYKFLPRHTITFSNIEFDTLAYIISHTQKKPREVISLFNVILSMANENKIPFTQLTSDSIREGTNVRVDDLSKGVLDMYKNIFKDADSIIRKTFNNSESIMTYGDMHRKLQEASSFFHADGMDRMEIEHLFTESGVIGVVESCHKYKDTDKLTLEVNFEYQIKNVMTLQSNHILAIHPMFYQELNAKVYPNVLVLPKASPTERNEMKKSIEE
jgi:KAP-like P-loop domain-containing protein